MEAAVVMTGGALLGASITVLCCLRQVRQPSADEVMTSFARAIQDRDDLPAGIPLDSRHELRRWCEDVRNARALRSLTRLVTSQRGLRGIPAELGLMIHLETVSVWGNRIPELPSSIGQLSALTFLNISDNNLKRLPTEIGGCTALTIFQANRNQIEELPDEMGALTSLRVLELDGNRISQLPVRLGYCRELVKLRVASNRLRHLPFNICLWTKMSLLSAADNQLTTVPTTINRLVKLRGLILTGNPIEVLPAEVAIPVLAGELILNGSFRESGLRLSDQRKLPPAFNRVKDEIGAARTRLLDNIRNAVERLGLDSKEHAEINEEKTLFGDTLLEGRIPTGELSEKWQQRLSPGASATWWPWS